MTRLELLIAEIIDLLVRLPRGCNARDGCERQAEREFAPRQHWTDRVVAHDASRSLLRWNIRVKDAVDHEDREQRYREHRQAREVVEKALRRGLAEIISDEDQDQHPHEVREDRDWDDRNGDHHERGEIGAVAKIPIEQADRPKADDGIQPGAGGRDEHLILRDLDRHPGARDGIAQGVEQADGPVRNRDLDWLGDGRDDRVRWRKR